MSSKPDKFGVKFWLCVDAETKHYLCNAMPYLGKDDTHRQEDDVPAHVCLKLLEPYLKKGYNVTTNYFTSHNLAEKLMQKQTTIVEVVRKQRREIPNLEDVMSKKLLHPTEIYQSPSECTLTVY